MSTALTVSGLSSVPSLPAADIEKAADLARQEKAKATQRAYGIDFEIFRTWCASRGVSALPATAESVAAFLACEVERGIRSSTIGRRVAAIRYAHKLAGHAVPTDDERVKATVRGIRRTIGTTARKKAPATAVRAWRDAAGIATGPLFRSIRKGGKVGARLTDQSVADIVKKHAARVGLDPALFAGHSLRAGFLTSAAKRGASIFKMMDVSRHRSVDTLRGYVRDAEIFKDHAGAGLL